MDLLDDKKSGIDRSSSDEKDGTKLSGEIDSRVVELSEKVTEVSASERATGPVKRRTAYFQALCDDLKREKESEKKG